MNEQEFNIEINGQHFWAIWHDRDGERPSAWYIYRNTEKVGRASGACNRQQVENFIRFNIANNQ